jgi:hypothetical protein
MQRTKLWLILAVAMIILGISLLSVAELVYVPRIAAYSAAAAAWSQNVLGSAVPSMADYGLDAGSVILASVIGMVGGLLLVVGVILLVIAIVLRTISRTRIEISVGTRF